jgi:hypothetical protein
VLDVVVAWALYRVFASVDESVSRLAAWFRLAYAAVFMVAIARLLEVLRLLDDDSLTALPTDQRQAGALSRSRRSSISGTLACCSSAATCC